MKKKYIIELEDNVTLWGFLTDTNGEIAVTGVIKQPYAEPDLERVKKTAHDDGYSAGYQAGRGELNRVLSDVESDVEQVRKEAYQKGYETGYEDGYNEPGKNQQEAYQRGLSDAWEAASEIAVIPYDEVEKIFGATGWHIFMKCTASEVIEKIKAWDEKKQEEIKVGDEVVFGNDEEIKAVVIDEADEAGVWLLLSGKGCVERMDGVLFHRTGRHFSELTSIFEKNEGGVRAWRMERL